MKAFALVLAAFVAAASAPARPASLPDFTALVKKQGPAVVNVTSKSRAAGAQGRLSPEEEFFRRFMPDLPERGAPPPGEGTGVGSGFIISEDGFILTNAHLVAGADEVTVRMADSKREFTAKVVGADERTDVALLKVNEKGLRGRGREREAGSEQAFVYHEVNAPRGTKRAARPVLYFYAAADCGLLHAGRRPPYAAWWIRRYSCFATTGSRVSSYRNAVAPWVPAP